MAQRCWPKVNWNLFPKIEGDFDRVPYFPGETAVLSSVNGPVEVKLSNLQHDKASVEVNYRPRTGLPQVVDRFKEHLIRGTCESALIPALYPRTAISIQLQEMEDNGGVRIIKKR